MKTRCLLLILLVYILGCSAADQTKPHKLVKRQFPPRPGLRAFPLSRSRQFPPPEELEESEEYVYSEDEEDKNAASPFRGRQPQRPPTEEEYTDDYSYTEAPQQTTPTPPKPTARTIVFNNRFAANRPRFGSLGSTASTTTTTTTTAPKPSAASTSRSRFRATPAQSQRLDVVANVLNKPAPPRPLERSFSSARTSSLNNDKKPVPSSSEAPTRRNTSRPRARGRFRTRTSPSTTTTTTTTTEPPLEEYYYYYEDEEDQKNQPIATTTSTTTTTTPKPSLPKRASIGRRPSSGRSQSTTKPVIKFDPESQFLPPPEDIAEVYSTKETYSTKKFTTSSTTTPVPGSAADAIPPHLRSKYKPRKDGRFVDFLRDPNRPRELKGFDLTDYPFYIKVPEDIEFECDDKKDGYYASVPHRCQLFHYCFAGARYDFLCANYTLYDQTTFTCRFANNVDCLSSAKYYYRNDDLWKETTTPTPETTTPRRRRTTPKEEDYEDYEDYDEYYDDEEERRRRPPKRRRNRRKNRRKPQEKEE